jgi:hypothetical protein
MSIKNIIIGIAIIILTIFVSVYGINTFYPSPDYKDYCREFRDSIPINEKECIDVGGKWVSYENVRAVPIEGEKNYCDEDYYCRQEYDKVREKHSRMVFIISIPLGILLIVLGAFLFHLDAVGAGLMGGGVGTFIFGAGGYWEYSDNLLKFIISLIGLGVVIYFAYWFNNKKEKKKFRFFNFKKKKR